MFTLVVSSIPIKGSYGFKFVDFMEVLLGCIGLTTTVPHTHIYLFIYLFIYYCQELVVQSGDDLMAVILFWSAAGRVV